MRRQLIIVECILIIALILCISMTKGFYPFEILSAEQLSKISVNIDSNEFILSDDCASAVIEKLNKLCAVQKFIRSEGQKASITLYPLDDDTYELELYENHIVLNGSAYACDSKYLDELLSLIKNFT